MKFRISLLWSVLILFAALCRPMHSEDLNKELMEALGSTQDVLKSPEERQKAATTPEAKKALADAEKLGGTPESTQKIFELAAQIFEQLAKDAKGDPDKMEEILEKAKKDPESFAEKLSPEVKSKLRDLSKEISAPNTKTKAP